MQLLKKLISKDFCLLTRRGNASILLSLKLAKKIGKNKVFIQDQGGWITYKPYAERLGFMVYQIPTEYGLVRRPSLGAVTGDSALLMHSMPGYMALQENMPEISAVCKKRNILLINDVSGSIGTRAGTIGDVLLASFGKWKPINLTFGGFIATDNAEYIRFLQENTMDVPDFSQPLHQKILDLPSRLEFWKELREKVLKDLSSLPILHRNKRGYNVVVTYKNKYILQTLKRYCENKSLPFTLCPRYIRVLEEAISIEIKRCL